MRSPAVVLTAANPTNAFQLPFRADQLHIYNQTPSAVWIRMGASSPPQSDLSADITIPPGDIVNLPVNAAEFGFAFSNSAALSLTNLSTLGTIGNKCVIIASQGEVSLTAASLNYTTLALSTPVLGSGATGTLGPFDLATWGGLLIAGHPNVNNWDTHGWCAYETSPDNITWTRRFRLPLWPGMELSAQLPRIERFGRIVWQPYGNPWAAAPTYSLVARPTIQEILQISPVLSGSIPEWTWGELAANGSQSIYVPGDLVTTINYFVTMDTGGTINIIDAFGYYNASLTAGVDLFLRTVGGAARSSTRGNIATPWPVIRIRSRNINSVASSAGHWGMLPLMAIGPPDVMGQLGDTSAVGTVPGFLDEISVNTRVLGAQGDAIGATTLMGTALSIAKPQDAGIPVAWSTAGAAGVWTSTLTDLPAGKRVYAIIANSSLAGGQWFAVGYGSAAGVIAGIYNAAAPNGPCLQFPFPFGFNYGANTRIWILTLAAATISGAIICA